MFIGGILRGTRSMVQKFAFLELEIGLRTPSPILGFFRNWDISESQWAYIFGLILSGFGMCIIILRGSLSNGYYGAEIRIFFVKKGFWGPAIGDFFKKIISQSQWAFVLVCSYSRVYVDKWWLLITSRRTNKWFSFFLGGGLNPFLRGQNRILLYVAEYPM